MLITLQFFNAFYIGNEISEEGVVAIGEALKTNKALTQLNLRIKR